MAKNSSRKIWQTARRAFDYSQKTLVMGILNVTPDSFSDGGKFTGVDAALRQAEKMIAEGADILDIGGESTRPNAAQVEADAEIRRVVPVIREITNRFDTAISIDTTKSAVAKAAVEAGAEIINDISGLNWDDRIGAIAADTNAGLILMHLRGSFETMHNQTPVERILPEVIGGLCKSVEKARSFGIGINKIALDIGIGFSKTVSQNLELLGQLDKICHELNDFPVLVGASRKSFIGKIINEQVATNRLHGTIAAHAVAIFNGAKIVRVHEVKPAVEAARVAAAIRNAKEF